MKQIPERYFSYAYQFTVLIAIIAMTFVVGDSREMLLGALIGVMTGMPFENNSKKSDKTTSDLNAQVDALLKKERESK